MVDEPATEDEKAIIKNILYLKKFKGQEKSILGQLRYSNKQAVEKTNKEWADKAEVQVNKEIEQRIGNREILAYEKGLAEHTEDEKKAVEKARKEWSKLRCAGCLSEKVSCVLCDDCSKLKDNRAVEKAIGPEFVEGLAEWHANYVFDKSACGKSSIRYNDIEESAKNRWRGLAREAIKSARWPNAQKGEKI